MSESNPFISAIREDVEISSVFAPRLSKAVTFILLLLAFSFNKTIWYRKWMRLREKTPYSFRALTRCLSNLNKHRAKDYDLLIQFGATVSPVELNKPYIIITDSTRNLTQNNSNDIWGKFNNPAIEAEWILYEKKVYQDACKILVGCGEVKESLIRFYNIPEKNIVISPLFINETFEIKPEDKQYDGKTVLIVAKGQFDKKGGSDTLKAFKIVKQRIPDAELHVVGQDKLEECNIDGVFCHGEIKDPQLLKELYKKANVFVLPSYIDRFGMSIVEAMSSATPCIVANYRAQPEIVAETGYTVDLGDYEKIADHIIELLSDRELSQVKGHQALDRYLNELSWKAQRNVFLDIVNTCGSNYD